jgi:hypothetical protein
MPQVRPFEISVGLGLETTYGTPVAPSVWIPGTSSLKKSPGRAVLERPVGVWEETRTTQRPTKVEGSLELEIGPGRTDILRSLLSRRTWRHLHSATVQETLGDQAGFRTCGVVVKTASFKVASGEDLIGNFEVLGRQRERVTPVAPLFASAPAPYTFEEMIATLAEGREEHFSEIELKYDFNIVDDKFRSDGTGLLREAPTDGQSVIVSIQHDLEHNDLWDAAMRGDRVALSFVFTRSGYTDMVWTLPLCEYQEGDRDGNEQPLELRALASGTTPAVIWTG